MSLLIFDITPDSVVIITDTRVGAPDGAARHQMSKCVGLPHLHAAIVVIGSAAMAREWVLEANAGVHAHDIVHLDPHVPDLLNAVWDRVHPGEPRDGIYRSTAYHFGLDRHTGSYVGFAYRSTDDFASTAMEYGSAAKPRPADFAEILERDGGYVELAEAARRDWLEEGAPQRIGGELIATVLEHDEIRSVTIHHFDDHEIGAAP